MDPELEGFEQCEMCGGAFDHDDLQDGICADCAETIANPNLND